MNRTSSRWSDGDEEAADDGINEQELQKLQRQYRRLCGDRRAYAKDSQNVLRKQKALIDALVAENAETHTNLDNTDSNQNKIKDDKITEILEDLIGHNDEYLDEILDEKEMIKDLDEEV